MFPVNGWSVFFVEDNGNYRVSKDLREMTIFAVQNLIKDPPFTRLDLISCRNLLIYLSAELQRRLLPIFHYALKPGGVLVLGPSETIGSSTELFETLDKKWKIFRRKETLMASHRVLDIPGEALRPGAAPGGTAPTRYGREPKIAAAIERLLLARYAPASVVVNDQGDIMFIHGRTGAFLEPTAGRPRLNILEMAREGLRLDLASALKEATTGLPEVKRQGVRVRTNGDFINLDLSVTRIREPEALRNFFLVALRPQASASESSSPPGGRRRQAVPKKIRELERDLKSTRESLQSTIEELETANEDLKSTNEELQSTNEELQSANEELETSREEMQSLNEELSTVNAELESKVDGLSRANDDMQNLLNSTEIATLFLDEDLCIKRYTDQARRLISLIQSDVGRPLADLVTCLAYDSLADDCREVLNKLIFKQAEVQTKDGHWYLMRIFPYRTSENVIDGVVLTFVDINRLKEAQSTRRLVDLLRQSPDAITVQDFEGRITAWNHGAEVMYGWSEAEALQMNIRRIVPEGKLHELDSLLERVRSGERIPSFETQRLRKDGRTMDVWLTATRMLDDTGRLAAIATNECDLTELKRKLKETA